MSTAEGVDAGVEVAVRISQGYCIYAGCFPINVIPPPMSLLADIGLNAAASKVPAIGRAAAPSGALGRTGLVKQRPRLLGGGLKFNTATAWMMGDGLGAPFAVGQAADKWFEAAGQLGQARAQLEELAYSLNPDQWSGDDREAFNTEVGELAQQIGDAELFAQIVAYSLSGAVFPLGAWPLGCSIVGVIQFVNASLFYAAVASIVGNLGPSEALYASGLATSVTCNRSLSIGRIALSAGLGLCAAGIVGGAVLDVVNQEDHGDEDATADLIKATVEMAVEQAVQNLAASGIEALTPGAVDVANDVLNPGQNNDSVQDTVKELDERLGDAVGSDSTLSEEAGDRAGDLVPGDESDRGPYSGG